MIIQCTQCATKLKVPDSSVGKKARCPSCSAIIDVDPVIDVVADAPPRYEPLQKPKPRRPASTTDSVADVSPDPAPAPRPSSQTPPSRRSSSAAERPAARKPSADTRDSSSGQSSRPKAAGSSSGKRSQSTPQKASRPAKKKAGATAAGSSTRPKKPGKKKRKKKKDPAYDDTYGFDDVASYGDAVDDYGYDDIEDYDDVEDYDDAEDFGNPYSAPTRSRSSRSSTSGGGGGLELRLTGIGLLMIAGGVVGIFVGVLGGIVASAAINEQLGAVLILGALGLGAVSIAIGHLLCLAAPGMGRILAILSLVCMGVQWAVNMRIRMGEAVSPEERVVGSVLGIASLFFIQMFLRTMATEARREDLAGRALGILLGYVLAAVLGAIAFGLLLSGPPMSNFGVIVAIVAGLMGLAIAIVQIILLFQLGSSLVAAGRSGSSGRSRKAARSSRPARSRSSRGHYVTFSYTISIVVLTFKMNSAPVHIGKGEGTFFKGLPYTLITLVLGWWGIPWGPIYSVMSIVENSRGGNEV